MKSIPKSRLHRTLPQIKIVPFLFLLHCGLLIQEAKWFGKLIRPKSRKTLKFNWSYISRATSPRVERAIIRGKNGKVTMEEGCWCGRANEKSLRISELQQTMIFKFNLTKKLGKQNKSLPKKCGNCSIKSFTESEEPSFFEIVWMGSKVLHFKIRCRQ